MSNFSPTKCYDLAKYDVTFDKKGISIIETATGKSVDDRKFSDGFDIMIHEGDFCFGDITFTKSFDNKVDLKLPNAGVLFQEVRKWIIGTEDDTAPVKKSHIYMVDLCPIRLKTDGEDILTITCPCDANEGPCSNKCYKFGPWN